MRWLGIIVLLFITSIAFCHPRDSARVVERKKAKIERKKERMMNGGWDQRSQAQRKTDRRALLFIAISAGVLVNTLATKHE